MKSVLKLPHNSMYGHLLLLCLRMGQLKDRRRQAIAAGYCMPPSHACVSQLCTAMWNSKRQASLA